MSHAEMLPDAARFGYALSLNRAHDEGRLSLGAANG